MSSSTTRFIGSVTRLCSAGCYASRVLTSNTTVLTRHQNLTQSLGYRYLRDYGRIPKSDNTSKRKFYVHNSVQPGAPLPSQPPSSPMRWFLGIVLTIVLPFVTNKYWGPLLEFKSEVDTAVETIEEIVDTVETVAEVVDKVAEDIADDIPADGKLKKVVDLAEDVAEKAAKDAHIVGDAIDKFQEVEKKVDNIVESLRDEANQHPREFKDGN